MPGGGPGGYPANMQTSAQRALHNNFGKCEALALAVSTAVNSALQDDWRNNAIKTRRMRLATPLVGDDEAVRLAVVEKLG